MLIAALALLLEATPAAEIRPSIITNPDWVRKPTGQDLARYYPMQAARNEVEGQATISCKVSAADKLVDCAVVSESPAGAGFGEAAVAMSASFQMRPQTRDGQPVDGGTVRIPMNFRLPPASAAPRAPNLELASKCYGLAAVRLEQEPTDDDARVAYFTWRMVTEVRLVREKLRPTELEARMLAIRMAAADRRRDGSYQADREKCDSVIHANGADMALTIQQLERGP